MLFENITILDENYDRQDHMYVGVKGSIIDYVGSEKPEEDYGESYDGKGKLLMSAFYNAHAHSPMTLLRGYAENLSLSDWLNTKVFPFEDKLYYDAVYWATLLSMAESFRFGIVSNSDMYYFCDDIARAVIESGAKENISRSISEFGPDGFSIKSGERYREMENLYKLYHNADDGKILVDASIHSEYTNTETSMREVADFAREHSLNMHVHVSETESEHRECMERHNGRTPVKLLYDLGAFETNTTAAHCVWVTDEDIAILKEKGVTVATNPISNLKLASGVCNIPKLLENGINVAIGTDSVCSNNSLNFIEEMKFFALLSKERYGNPTLITPKQTIYAATRAGALAQGRPDCGLLKAGFKADLIVLDLDVPNMHPMHDVATNLVYSASGSDVLLTMCDGKVVYRNGEYLTVDVEKAIVETEAACENIKSRL